MGHFSAEDRRAGYSKRHDAASAVEVKRIVGGDTSRSENRDVEWSHIVGPSIRTLITLYTRPWSSTVTVYYRGHILIGEPRYGMISTFD